MKKASYIEDIHKWETGFSYSYPIKVRFCETDMFGHVNNTTIFTYFEEARIEFFKSIGLMQEWMNGNSELIPVVADLQCDYLAQTFFDETLLVFVKIQKIGRSSLDLHYMCKKENGIVAFTGRGTIVQINKKTGKACEWNEKWVAQFKQHMLQKSDEEILQKY
ncbi:acyl-CoA thioesterase [Bacillus salitolerans]|uniref:Acyl-CoA thioesterase n=1 Tax=Bacillus salitolerans TaxID=1437434 RepID=A0ABW4LLA6_9BACI